MLPFPTSHLHSEMPLFRNPGVDLKNIGLGLETVGRCEEGATLPRRRQEIRFWRCPRFGIFRTHFLENYAAPGGGGEWRRDEAKILAAGAKGRRTCAGTSWKFGDVQENRVPVWGENGKYEQLGQRNVQGLLNFSVLTDFVSKPICCAAQLQNKKDYVQNLPNFKFDMCDIKIFKTVNSNFLVQ